MKGGSVIVIVAGFQTLVDLEVGSKLLRGAVYEVRTVLYLERPGSRFLKLVALDR